METSIEVAICSCDGLVDADHGGPPKLRGYLGVEFFYVLVTGGQPLASGPLSP